MTQLFYFAYGSNLFSERIKLSIPNIQFHDTAYVKDFKLEFGLYSKRWNGACATIVPKDGHLVWGVVWLVSQKDKEKLDKQELVDAGVYSIKELACFTKNGDNITCFCYTLAKNDDCYIPSKLYKSVIIRGAKEHLFPETYIKKIENIQDNGFDIDFDSFKKHYS